MCKLDELRKMAFDVNSEPLSPTSSRKAGVADSKAREFKRLGFKNFQNPVEEFQEVPPGILALDCMNYFAKHQSEAYTRVGNN